MLLNKFQIWKLNTFFIAFDHCLFMLRILHHNALTCEDIESLNDLLSQVTKVHADLITYTKFLRKIRDALKK